MQFDARDEALEKQHRVAATDLQTSSSPAWRAGRRNSPSAGRVRRRVLTSVSLFDQALAQVVQAAATGLEPKTPHVLALSDRPDGAGPLRALATFTTNPAGAAIANAIGPIRQPVGSDVPSSRRYLGTAAAKTDGRLQVRRLDATKN